MAPRTAAAGAAPATTPGGLTGLRERLRGRPRKPSIEWIYRDHHQAIYRYCLAIVRNPADAEDAMQATMAAAMRSLPRDRGAASIRPWLFRVAHNESISIIRGRRETPSEDPVLDEDSDSAADELESRERLQTLVADLQALPERQRSALVMRELSGLAYSEIGEALKCGEGAARQVVHEARTALLTRTEGRAMGCEEARELIDSGDRRRLRGRKLSAHLSACAACSEYRAGIEARERDLRALCPPLPIAAAGGIFAALSSGGGAGAGSATAGGGAAVAGSGAGAAGLGATTAAGGLGSAAAVKGASIAAAAVIAAGAADATGVVELPGTLDLGGGATETRPAPGSGAGPDTGAASESTGAAAKPGSAKAKEARAQGELASSRKGANGKGKGKGKRRDNKGRSGRNGNPGRGKGAPGANGNEGGGGVGQGNPGTTPSPGPPASTPASPPQVSAGGGSSAAPASPPPNSNAGGGGKSVAPGPPAGTPGGGPPG